MNQIRHYRGKSKVFKRWIYGGAVSEDDGTVYIKRSLNAGCEEVIPESVGQSTGLKDRNGKEIFEGNIIKEFNIGPNEGYKIGLVVWCNESGCWGVKVGEKDYEFLALWISCEIIGNQFQNPELIDNAKWLSAIERRAKEDFVNDLNEVKEILDNR